MAQVSSVWKRQPQSEEQRHKQQAYQQKYRLVTTITSKAVEAAQKCGIKINVVTYDDQVHRIREHFTHEDFRLKSVFQMMHTSGIANHHFGPMPTKAEQSAEQPNRRLKFQSRKARLKADIMKDGK